MIRDNNIPTDVINTISKLRIIIDTIENNLHKPKSSILLEISIELNLSIEAVRKIFRNNSHLDIGFGTYILERKRAETIKAIKELEDRTMVDEKIKQISNCNRYYFDRMLYNTYGVRVIDLLEDRTIELPIVEKLDVNIIENNIKDVMNTLKAMIDEEILEWKLQRTKLCKI